MSRRALFPLLVLAAAAAAEPLGAQCAMCKSVLEGSVEGRRIVEGLNHGILLMVAAPYAILGTFLAVMFRQRLLGALARFRTGRVPSGIVLAAKTLAAGD